MARFVLLCWRDCAHPQGGGSERYLEHVGRHLASRGHEVEFRTARYRGSSRRERSGGVTYIRGGNRLGVYPRAWAYLLRRRLFAALGREAPIDAVIDTQNGVPFFAAPFSGAPTIVLTHHCHREQWPVAGPVLARIGWWTESRLSPLVHRRRQWLTVSGPSADELARLGVPAGNIAIVRNGVDPVPEALVLAEQAAPLDPSAPSDPDGPAAHARPPRLVVLSRLVPHKHVEDALDALAELHPEFPGLRLDVIGDGWWAEKLRERAAELGVGGDVDFHGHVSEERKHEILAGADLHLMPSRKEGWGLAVIEAGQHGVPTIGYLHAAGLRDSIDSGRTGLLVEDLPQLVSAARGLLSEPARRSALGAAARAKAETFSWTATGDAVEWLLGEAAAGRIHAGDIAAPAGGEGAEG